MFRNLTEYVVSSAEMKSLIHERISGDVMNQVIRMDVAAVEAADATLPAEAPRQQANSLGYGSTQGAVGKSGAGKGWGGWRGKDQKGKGFGIDQKGKSKDG